MSRQIILVFCIGLLTVAVGYGSPGLCMLAGFGTSLFFPPAGSVLKHWGKLLMAWAIVGLGFTIPLGTVYQLGSETFLVTMVAIALTVVLGIGLGRLWGIPDQLHALIAAGTSICGASAIAAVGAGTKAKSEYLGVALGVILIFNTIALFLFPWLGTLLGLSPADFAIWSGLAIHDTSSVVGAAITYDHTIVDHAVTVKLARAVWIVPLVLFYQGFLKSGSEKRLQLPWFLWGFLLASLAVSLLPPSPGIASGIKFSARLLFAAALFLLGYNLEWRLIRTTGLRPIALGGLLWIGASGVALLWLSLR